MAELESKTKRVQCLGESKNETIFTHQNETHFREHCRVVYIRTDSLETNTQVF